MWIKVTRIDDRTVMLVDEYKIARPIIDRGHCRHLVFDAVKTLGGEEVVVDGVSVTESLDEIRDMLNGTVKQIEETPQTLT